MIQVHNEKGNVMIKKKYDNQVNKLVQKSNFTFRSIWKKKKKNNNNNNNNNYYYNNNNNLEHNRYYY